MVESLPQALPAFDARTLPQPCRLRAWADKLNELYYPLDVDNNRSNFCIGALSSVDVGGVRLGMVDSDAVLINRRRTHLCGGGGDFYLVPMALNAPLRLSQRGREAIATPTSLVFVGTCDPYVYEQQSRAASVTLRIPGSLLRERILGLDDWTARSLSAVNPSVALFLDFARSFCRYGAKLSHEEGLTSVNHLLSLLSFAIIGGSGVSEAGETAVQESHRQRALRAIDNRLSQAELTPSLVADVVGLSERHLQRVFAKRGERLSRVIRMRRLAEARRLLADRKQRGRSIAAIGYQVGFADPGYFNRIFRKEFGITPMDFRWSAVNSI